MKFEINYIDKLDFSTTESKGTKTIESYFIDGRCYTIGSPILIKGIMCKIDKVENNIVFVSTDTKFNLRT